MKRTILLFTSLIILFSACNTSNSEHLAFDTDNASFTSGNWHITGFTKNGKTQKSNAFSYNFKFSTDNQIIATSTTTNCKGTWYVISGDGTDDAPPDDTGLKITFSNKCELINLNGNWIINERTPFKLLLSKGELNTSRSYLMFKKM